MKKLIISAVLGLFGASLVFADTLTGIEAFRSKDYDAAREALQPAALSGDPEALYYLGQMYAAGFGVEKNLTQAQEFYRAAAEEGHVGAQKEYGTALAIGDGVEQNVEEGLKWLFIAARSGDESANLYAASFARHLNRMMVLTARKQAIEWHQAFNQRNAAAQPVAP